METVLYLIILMNKLLKHEYFWKTSLLRRLQEQTLPDEAPPMGKIHHSAKLL